MNKTVTKILNIVLILVMIGALASPLIGTAFTYPSEDDFSYESGGSAGAAEFGSSLIGSLYKVTVIYKMQQGCYTAMFLDHFIRPYSRFGLPGFHIAIIGYMVLFIWATWLVFSALSRKNKTVSYCAMAAAMLSTFTMTGSVHDTKLFYWYTAVVGYTLMFTFSMFALYFSVLSVQETDNRKVNLFLVLSAIFAFLGSGGSLVITSPTCSFLLAVVIVSFDRVKEKKKLLIPFVFAMIGALVNVAAPGNYQRASADLKEGHTTVFDAFRDAFVFYLSEMKKVFDPIFIAVILAVLLIGVLYKVRVRENGISNRLMGIIFGGVVLIQYFTVFPAAYGYHTNELSTHVTGMYDIIARFTFIFLGLCISQWLGETVVDKLTGKVSIGGKVDADHVVKYALGALTALALLLALVLPSAHAIVKDSFTARTFRDFKNGRFADVYRIREYELTTFELAEEGTDCIIYIPWDVECESLPGLGIGSDSEWFTNVSAAHLFNLHTTTVLMP
ncbi:hypothetical protein [Butyrivibrio hungatei]|uniref:Uncharacterized protein n=1 Tax=Butyrivibrio hungatei TaxID=185008 RepID=A0A1D9NZ23_9FIRM|nr:hypothetical protein [Butyrivibrio hungatei]AOZ95560.1 hypothetical protein bhn_I0526 [Butyrivibrio hungatei]